VLELRARHFHEDEGAPLTVRALPAISRDRIVLPEGVLERVERQAFGVAEGTLRVTADHLEQALEELRQGADELTNALLGARRSRDDDRLLARDVRCAGERQGAG
jgi:hypothetical protein